MVHIQTTEQAVNDLLGILKELVDAKIKAGFMKPEPQVNGSYKDIYVRRKL